MKQLITIFCLTLLLTACNRSGRDTWEDTKTCGRYVNKGLRSLMGYHEDGAHLNRYSRWSSEEEFTNSSSHTASEFIPMYEREEGQLTMSEFVPPAKSSPGDPHSPIPGIDAFSAPSGYLATLFSNVHFDTDQYTVVGEENIKVLHLIAKHLIAHPDTYVFVEGHADERGAAAYNLALGSRRANSVRSFLVQNGVNPDQLFAISYGKERPLVAGHDGSAWEQNRRAQFKVYDRA